MRKIDAAANEAYTDRVKIAYGQKDFGPAGLYSDQVKISTKDKRNVSMVRVIGAVEAGAWGEAVEWPEEDKYTIPYFETKEWAGAAKYALEVYGPSMNKVYAEGTILICVPIVHVDRNPVPGERVIVQRRTKHGLYEATVKEFQLDDRGQPWLWPRSTHPEHQTPLRFPEGDLDGEDSVSIVALVIASFQPEPTAHW
ncbi:MAG: S24 family peptidase [Reyranella sp.]|uniref:S24 family peptidase n=1 Tax=Reyranella sp. TaxID=1929291 RepID=UPI003D0D54B7